nr:DUF3499 family protein [Leifsonia psychrotolerans]
MSQRPCSRISCADPAVATLTYVYADSMAVLGPLSDTPEPHCYDLCRRHADRTSAPQGWQIIRHRVFSERPTHNNPGFTGESRVTRPG